MIQNFPQSREPEGADTLVWPIPCSSQPPSHVSRGKIKVQVQSPLATKGDTAKEAKQKPQGRWGPATTQVPLLLPPACLERRRNGYNFTRKKNKILRGILL